LSIFSPLLSVAKDVKPKSTPTASPDLGQSRGSISTTSETKYLPVVVLMIRTEEGIGR